VPFTPQKIALPPFCFYLLQDVKKHWDAVPSSDITFTINLVKIVKLVQTVKLGRTYTQAQHGNLVHLLTFSRKEGGLNESGGGGRTNCLRSFDMTRTAQKTTPPIIFVAGEPRLSRRCLPTIGRYTDKPTDASINFSIVAYVFVAAATFLLSRCLATIG
jgi:hypothetical protein